jgi:hypothetical protein
VEHKYSQSKIVTKELRWVYGGKGQVAQTPRLKHVTKAFQSNNVPILVLLVNNVLEGHMLRKNPREQMTN